MKSPKAFKIQDVNRKVRKGIVARSLAEIKKKGTEKLGFPNQDCSVFTEDGTEVDDEDYFSSLPDQTVLVFVRPGEQWNGYVTVLKQATEKVFKALSQRDNIIQNIHNFMSDGQSGQIYCIMAEVVNRLQENIDAEDREDDKDWFEGVGGKYQTKTSVLKSAAQSRIRNYLYKAREILEKDGSTKATKLLLGVLKNFKEKLKNEDYFGNYFMRSGTEKVRLCCSKGWFECQGQYNVEHCTKLHKINPYGSRESRVLFSTWNLDHVIEKSRQVLPSLLEAAENCPRGYHLNWAYFFDLLFTVNNLKLVNIGCHDKGEHHGYECNKNKYYIK